MSRPKFITRFLIPSLDDERFGPRLEWLDRKNGIFQLQWNHKAAHAWTEYDAEVFTEWDKMKGRYEPLKKGYFSRSKQRFRALLYKFTNEQQLRRLQSFDKKFQKYCIVKFSTKGTPPAVETELFGLSEEEEEMMDFSTLWNGAFTCSSDNEKENVSLPAVLKEHTYSMEEGPQWTDIEDPLVLSDVHWAGNLSPSKFYPICDLVLKDSAHSDVHNCFDKSHPKDESVGSLHVELITLLETEHLESL